MIAKLARSGDPAAVEAFQMEGRYLGQALAACTMILNPERIIIGGGVALETVQKEARAFAGSELPKIQATGLGYDGGLLGAAAIALCEQNC